MAKSSNLGTSMLARMRVVGGWPKLPPKLGSSRSEVATRNAAEIVLVQIASIRVPERWRAIDEEAMPGLMDGISKVGLLHPITLTRKMTKGYELVGGRHRLEAHIRLGLKTIVARIIDREAAGLARPSENQHRAKGSVLLDSEEIIEYRDKRLLWDENHKPVAPKGGAQPHDRGNSKTARHFGLTASRIRKAVGHVSICEAAKDILRSNPKAQTVAALDRIAKLASPDDQVSEAKLLVSGKKAGRSRTAKSKKIDKSKGKSEPRTKYPALWTMWTKSEFAESYNTAGDNDQRQFIDRLKIDTFGDDEW